MTLLSSIGPLGSLNILICIIFIKLNTSLKATSSACFKPYSMLMLLRSRDVVKTSLNDIRDRP